MNKIAKPFLICSLFLLSINSLQAQDCDCPEAFDAAVEAYEENYSLFMYKVTDENRDFYDAHTDLMRTKAEQTNGIQECKVVLEKWLEFFRDGHTYILMNMEEEKEISNENIDVTENQYKLDYQNNSYEANPILGIWKSGDYTVAIMPAPENGKRERDYVGVVLESSNPDWKKGEIKFELTANFGTSYQIDYMMADHSVEKASGQQVDHGLLEIDGLGEWVKLWPEVPNSKKSSEIESKYNEFHISYIDEVPYLRLPDFYSVDRSHIDSLMKSHHENVLKADFMVVDVRGNRGGSDGTYFPVLPYILSGPVELPEDGFWLSEYNTGMLLGYMAANQGLSLEEYAAQEKEEYDRFMSNKGTAYFEDPEYSWTFNADTLYSGPKRVIILTDEETGSSGETFVYRANQSDKVVVYGQNTAGVVDGFNGMPKDIGCFQVVFPSSFRAKDIAENPIDPYGIAPDVYVNKKEDVLTYAIEHMKHLIENEKYQN